MIRELGLVVLLRALPEYGLQAGDIGTVVHAYSNAAGYEVEFAAASGETVAVATLAADEVRPFSEREILHSRTLSAV